MVRFRFGIRRDRLSTFISAIFKSTYISPAATAFPRLRTSWPCVLTIKKDIANLFCSAFRANSAARNLKLDRHTGVRPVPVVDAPRPLRKRLFASLLLFVSVDAFAALDTFGGDHITPNTGTAWELCERLLDNTNVPFLPRFRDRYVNGYREYLCSFQRGWFYSCGYLHPNCTRYSMITFENYTRNYRRIGAVYGLNDVCPSGQVYHDGQSPPCSCPDGLPRDATTHECTTCPLGASPVNGQCLPAFDPTVEKNQGQPQACVGNPCNPTTGNKYLSEQDYRSEGGLSFARYYNSTLNQDVGLGWGWASTYHQRLQVSGTSVVARRADGRGELFNCTNSTCQGDADSTIALSKEASGYSLSRRDGGAGRYDTSGRLLSETDPAGKTINYTYDTNGRLATVAGPFGHTLTFTYDTNGRLASVTDPAGGVIRYGYDTRGNLAQATYADGSTRGYHYENTAFPHHLTGITDETGARFATYAYDTAGKAVSTEHAGGQERFQLRYDSATQTTVTDAAGTQEVLTFQETLGVKNLVGRVNQSDGKGVNQTFDAQNNLLSRTDELGRTTSYTYNATNQRLTETVAAGTPEARTLSYTYLSASVQLPTRIVAPSIAPGRSRETAIEYTGLNPTRITQQGFTPDGAAVARSIVLEYNARGQVVRLDGPRTDVADVTTFEYDDCTSGGGCGQLRKVTNALNHVTSFDAYDANGRLLEATDPNGAKTRYGYDARGRVRETATVTPTGATRTTRYTYDAGGKVSEVVMPDGARLSYAYDAARNLRTVTDALGNRIEYGYDSRGNRITEKILDPGGTLVRSVEYSHDLRNRLAAVNAGGSVTQQVHDALGNLLTATDANGNTTRFEHDALNRLLQTVDALAGNTRYRYDASDRLKEVAAPNGAATGFVYDDLGNLLEERSPDRGRTAYGYDAAGNVTTQLDARGIAIAFNYDALNRVTRIDYPGAEEDVSYRYDTATNCTLGIGRLCAVQDAGGATEYAYDDFGNILTQRYIALGLVYTTSYAFDAGNRVSSIRYPDGRVVTYSRDAVGRVAGVSALVNGQPTLITQNLAYRPDGLLSSATFGNGLAETRVYDLQGRLTQQTFGTETRTYRYDANGNLLERAVAGDGSSYRYDALDRLLEDRPVGTDARSYTYDPNGNRLSVTKGTETKGLSYSPQSNRLSAVGNKAVGVDAAGNTVSIDNGKWRLTYNAAGRLAAVAHERKTEGSYRYNFQGLRTQKTTDKGTIVYHYDLAGQLINETTREGYPLRAYVYADHRPTAQIDWPGNEKAHREKEKDQDRNKGKKHDKDKPHKTKEKLVFLHTDHLGTPRAATNPQGTIVWRWEGGAFGENKPQEDPDNDGEEVRVLLRFPGQYYDKETGFFYNWNRYYSPKIGRYLSSDPIGLAGGLNTYAYVNGNPLFWIDPWGLYPNCFRGLPRVSISTRTVFEEQILQSFRMLHPENYLPSTGGNFPPSSGKPPIGPEVAADWWMWEHTQKRISEFEVTKTITVTTIWCEEERNCNAFRWNYDDVKEKERKELIDQILKWFHRKLYKAGTNSWPLP